MIFPALVSTNIRFLIVKIPRLIKVPDFRIYVNTCLVYNRESWLSKNTEEEQVYLEHSAFFEWISLQEKTNGADVNYMGGNWSGKSSITFGVFCSRAECHG